MSQIVIFSGSPHKAPGLGPSALFQAREKKLVVRLPSGTECHLTHFGCVGPVCRQASSAGQLN